MTDIPIHTLGFINFLTLYSKSRVIIEGIDYRTSNSRPAEDSFLIAKIVGILAENVDIIRATLRNIVGKTVTGGITTHIRVGTAKSPTIGNVTASRDLSCFVISDRIRVGCMVESRNVTRTAGHEKNVISERIQDTQQKG